MNLRKRVSKSLLYSNYVNILNGVLQLSKREAEVFSFILAADANGENDNINSRKVRSAITEELDISEPNLSKYLSVLKTQNLIVRSRGNKWVVHDYIRPIVVGGILEVTITLELLNEVSRQVNKTTSEEIQQGSEGNKGDSGVSSEIHQQSSTKS